MNAFGETVKELGPRGTCSLSDHDGRGRVWQRREYVDAACTQLESMSTWHFDAAGGIGLLASEGNGKITRVASYDGLGRLAQMTTDLDGQVYTEEWTFDDYGRPFQHLFEAGNLPKTGERMVYGPNGYLNQVRSAYPLGNDTWPVYREILAMNARGQVTHERGSAGLDYTLDRGFDPHTGRVTRLLAQSGAVGLLQDAGYRYDALGNLVERSDFDGLRGLVESFAYDKLQRLLTATVKTSGGQPLAVRTQAYDNQGNLTARSDVGSYSYERPAACSGHALPGPNAVSQAGGEALCYDAGGNVVKRGGTTIHYDAGGRARDLVHAGNDRRVAFDYGPNGERVRRVEYPSALSGIAAKHVVHYVGGAEIRYEASGAGTVVDVRRMAGQVQVVQWGSGDAYRLGRRIVLTDAQGSVSSVLGAMTLQPVNEAGAAGFDAFGQRRDAATWAATTPWTGDLEALLRASTTQGYTGHEMAESVGIIHMGGRIYDARLGRFLQADPFVQSPHDLQSWNRYSYALNNPLLYTDPSGYLSVGDALRVVAAVAITVYSGGAAAGAWSYFGASIAAGSAQAYAVVAVGGFAAGAVQTGTLKGAVTGAVSAGVFYGIGSAFSQANASWVWEGDRLSWSGYAAKTLSHGAAGGVMAELQGGSFGHGFASAGFGEAVSPTVADIGSVPAQAIAVSVVGGTASVLAGGKFGNGAVTAAFGFAFNQVAHRRSEQQVDEMALDAAKAHAEDIVWRTADFDGIVRISSQEFLDIFEGYELPRLRAGLQNLGYIYGPRSFINFAHLQGDSLFYGQNGGREYMIGGYGPYLGGNINYFNQGIIFSLAGLPPQAAYTAVIGWNTTGQGSPQYLFERLWFTDIGYQWAQSK